MSKSIETKIQQTLDAVNQIKKVKSSSSILKKIKDALEVEYNSTETELNVS